MTMNRTFALAFACGASLCVPANADDAGPARGPVSVFVTPATPYEIPKPELDVLKKEANAALQAFDKEVEEVRKAHGKEWAKWPESVKIEVDDKRLVVNQDLSRVYFANQKPKDLEDSVRDIRNSFEGKGLAGRKEFFVVTESRDEAALIVEVVGRSGGSKLVRSPKYMSIIVREGPGIAPGTLARLPRFWLEEVNEFVAQTHRATEAEPWVQFQSFDVERWRDVANNVSRALNELVEKGYDIFVPPAS